MTRDAIVTAAVDLTRTNGLDGWSLRDLAAHLDTSLSVIYHHLGDRDRVTAAVAERVWTMIEVPLDEPDWRRWLYGVLAPMNDHLRQYPGVAAWFLRNGPQLEVLMPVVDAGVSRLLEAGFGDEAALAYAMAFNTCIGLIATGERYVRGDTDSSMASLARMLDSTPSAGPGTAHLRQMVAQYADDGESRDQARRILYTYALERTLDGLETRLRQVAATEH
ncbi:hypothetical protein OH799_05720 [Nocardia sp. NBC_00881]|uniref:TetR/AcrR family transcriptional regulator n=1 Tax=Nocardia sp. NBC_00881 TaxID=2975995 RepID=UPI00386E5B22|nr:hypothetical protein OH799_05720 [Nocardia sp. NBC_00881]